MLNRDLWLISKDFLKIVSEKNVLVSTVIVRKTKPEAINRKRIFSCTRRGGAFFSLLGKWALCSRFSSIIISMA